MSFTKSFPCAIAATGATVALICGCAPTSPPPPAPAVQAESPIRPVASIQELMQAEVDTSADGVWNAVATISTAKGVEEHRPQTAEEWAAVRLSAMTLIEATNLLMMDGRALDSKQIQALIDAKRPQFNAFAAALRDAGIVALANIDAKDPQALVKAGGAMEAVCEACHLTFWYPNQVIPPFPGDNDPKRPIHRLGTPVTKARN
jgi:hypothetical protein